LYPLVVVLGPTGAGKSALALSLARAFQGEVVNCDSVQVYRGLDIGSAKLPAARRHGISHHLLDIVEPADDLTAGAYARQAREVLRDIQNRARLPVIAGGTGFYLRSLLDGLSPAPARDAALHARLSVLRERRPAALHRFLRRCDATSARRIHPNDHQKLIRAIELTRIPTLPREPLSGFRVLKIGLNPERRVLYNRLDQRSAALFEGGLIEETRTLLSSGIAPRAKCLQTLGYKQAVDFLSGALPLPEAIRECQTKTRQYAKRQITWFRREAEVHWLAGFGADSAVEEKALHLTGDFLACFKMTESGAGASHVLL
jgi:tRNA dimethylallyltransferase